MSSDFFDLRNAYRDIENERASRMQELLEISTAMNATLDEDTLLPMVMDRIVDLLEADRGHLVLLRSSALPDDDRAGENYPFETKVSLVRDRKGGKEEGLLSQTIIRRVIDQRKPILLEDALHDSSIGQSRSVYELGLRSVMATPLVSRGTIIGVLSVENRKAVGVFNNEDLEFLQIFGSQAAVAIENAGLYRNLKEVQGQLSRAHQALKLEVVESQEALQQERERLQTLESEVRHLDKMAAMGMMVSSIAHELNNPLTGALGFAELLGRGDNLTEKQRHMLGHISSEMGRCAEIIRSLLKFSRKAKEQREALQLNRLVRDAVDLRRYQFEVSNVTIREDYSDAVPLMLLDNVQLKGVILNLLNNAFDAIQTTAGSGLITVTTQVTGDRVLLEISDTGGGIKDLAKIFDPFYTTKDVGKGTGLGLSVAYGVVHSHGGKILASNTDVGAKLTISLPLAPVQATEPPRLEMVKQPVSAPRSDLRVLVVDDEMVVRDLVKAVLEGEGYQVDQAGSGNEGCKLMETHTYDLVITDLRMPGGMSGMDVYHWIEKNRPQLSRRVVFITGDLLTQNLRDAMDQVSSKVLSKPFEVVTLLHAARETLARDLS